MNLPKGTDGFEVLCTCTYSEFYNMLLSIIVEQRSDISDISDMKR